MTKRKSAATRPPGGVPRVTCPMCPDVPGRHQVRFFNEANLAEHMEAIHGHAPLPATKRYTGSRYRDTTGELTEAQVATARANQVAVKPRTSEQLAGVPLSKWTDDEVAQYVAFVLETAAHLAGGFGALKPDTCLRLAERLRQVGSAHAVNVRNPTNWAAGPRTPE
jgi:hypothetical protein